MLLISHVTWHATSPLLLLAGVQHLCQMWRDARDARRCEAPPPVQSSISRSPHIGGGHQVRLRQRVGNYCQDDNYVFHPGSAHARTPALPRPINTCSCVVMATGWPASTTFLITFGKQFQLHRGKWWWFRSQLFIIWKPYGSNGTHSRVIKSIEFLCSHLYKIFHISGIDSQSLNTKFSRFIGCNLVCNKIKNQN